MIGIESLVLPVFRSVYRRRQPRLLPTKHPRFTGFPKHSARSNYPQG